MIYRASNESITREQAHAIITKLIAGIAPTSEACRDQADYMRRYDYPGDYADVTTPAGVAEGVLSSMEAQVAAGTPSVDMGGNVYVVDEVAEAEALGAPLPEQ